MALRGTDLKPMWGWSFVLLVASLAAHQTRGTCYPAIFHFGDNDGDTGGMHASFPKSTVADFPPYGETFFGYPQGRNSNGRLIVDFIAEEYGLRYLDPYFQSVTSDFSQGANFAIWGSVARPVSYLSPFPLSVQVTQFQLFQAEVLEVLNEASTVLASKGLLGRLHEMVARNSQHGFQPYKELYNDLFNSAAVNTSSFTTVDPDLQRALEAAERLPLPEYFTQGLYLISIGTNDFKVGIAAKQTLSDIQAYLPDVVTSVTNAVQTLYKSGARNIIVSGVGNIGCSPALLTTINHTMYDLDNWKCLADYNTLARNYNTLLQQGLTTLTPQLPSASVTYLDIYQIQHNFLFNYTQNGFVEILKACCGVPSTYNYDPQVLCGQGGIIANVVTESQTCADPGLYAGWDGIHFTDAANKYFAEQIFSAQFFYPPFQLFGGSANCKSAPV